MSEPKPPLPRFSIEDPKLASALVELREGDYHLRLHYDVEGRLVLAEAENKVATYVGSLRLQPSVPEGSFWNNCGDSVHWKDGVESYSSSFGPFEQSGREKIAYGDWVAHHLLVLCGRNAG